MPLRLNQIPGWSDQPDDVLEAELPAFAIHAGRISNNAAFGMVRLEFFQDIYVDGDTVILPTSKRDGENYKRDELTYQWNIRSTVSPQSGWISGPDALWFFNHQVEQDTGKVHCEEWYRRSGENDQNQSSKDGKLFVTTIAQRLNQQLICKVQPAFKDDQTALIAADAAYKTGLATNLNIGAKFSVLGTEVIYMGEFTDGNRVPQPVSPADGYTYSYAETRFGESWRWTSAGAIYTQPDKSLGQLQTIQTSISADGVVSTLVVYCEDVGNFHAKNEGRVAVHAFCTRSPLV